MTNYQELKNEGLKDLVKKYNNKFNTRFDADFIIENFNDEEKSDFIDSITIRLLLH